MSEITVAAPCYSYSDESAAERWGSRDTADCLVKMMI